MRKKIFILFLILIPFNVFALTRAPIDITNETVTSLSQALNEEIITSEQLINIYLERINEYNAQYDALITINENAINEAKELDKERQNGNIKSLKDTVTRNTYQYDKIERHKKVKESRREAKKTIDEELSILDEKAS